MGDGKFVKGHKRGGRPAKTEEERAAYEYLCEKTQKAARRLVELEDSTEEKIALAAVLGHLKIVVGEFQRTDDGKASLDEHEGWTKAEILELIRSGK